MSPSMGTGYVPDFGRIVEMALADGVSWSTLEIVAGVLSWPRVLSSVMMGYETPPELDLLT